MSAPEALSAEKRRLILDSARDAFAAHGYAGASMSAITKAAGVSKATVYHHFESKAALFGAFVARECEQLLRNFADASLPAGDPASSLTTIGRVILGMMISPLGVTMDRVVTAESATFPELAETFYAAGPERALGWMASWLERETKAGRLAVADPGLAADQFFSLVQARLVLRARLGMGVPKDDELTTIVAAAVRLFLAGYAV